MGARVRRSIGRPELRNFDPFLMVICLRTTYHIITAVRVFAVLQLDEFRVAAPAGFPDHPHRFASPARCSDLTFPCFRVLLSTCSVVMQRLRDSDLHAS